MAIKVAIIDEGVEKSHPKLANCQISGITVSKGKSEFEVFLDKYEDSSGHGTTIASIIHKKAPKAELFVVKLSAKNNELNTKLLIEGIRICLKDKDIKIINISMGVTTRTPNPELYEICRKALNTNVYIVASVHKLPSHECYPGCFPFVFGVISGFVKKKENYRYLGDGKINVIANGTSQRITWKNGYKTVSGTSYATAQFSGTIAAILTNNPHITTDTLKSYLAKHSNNNILPLRYLAQTEEMQILKISTGNLNEDKNHIFSVKKRLFFMKKVAVLCAKEKEIYSISNFDNLFSVDTLTYINYSDTFSNDLNLKLNKKNLLDNDFKNLDTIVIGSLLDQGNEQNIIEGHKIIDKGLALNKNFVTWDLHIFNLIQKKIQENKSYRGIIHHVKVDEELFNETMKYRYLPEVSVPVLAVISNNCQLESVITQLIIREILLNEGYNVSHVSTEPQDIILNADFIFPYGSKSSVYLDLTKWKDFLSVVMKGIQRFNSPHLILTGTQGTIIPKEPENYESNGFIFSSLNYLYAIKPDAIIYVIDPKDSLHYIRKTIQTIKIYCNTTILFCVLNSSIFSSKNIKSVGLQKKLNLPVLNILDKRNSKFVLKRIKEAFSYRELS